MYNQKLTALYIALMYSVSNFVYLMLKVCLIQYIHLLNGKIKVKQEKNQNCSLVMDEFIPFRLSY